MIIEINVSNKIARLADKNTVAVCENSDYVIHFNFDEEWAKFETKTARFKWGGKYTDVVFTGNECAMPIINNVYSVKIGVYAGDLHTTTSALLMMKKSIRCGNEPESSASQEVRNEFLGVLDKRTGDLSALQTDAKDNLVSAINEVNEKVSDIAYGEDAIETLAELGIVVPAQQDGTFYMSPIGEIYTI